ncbi:type I-D CRISPR-associated protein Cas5/Csc1 [Halorussus halophilus]|uniref:type I-D CRISPR-associated protein Cas5/Csc1 n=1 Tax=Halorussus halophilus TaxID=2650975 RepID=UPI001300DBF1|nr:type I-D CRISPR-associated protein Cas5/Csc1 [Halorussus halophilus]
MTGQVLEARLQTQGEVWFASREVGRLADTESFVLNTALYYALGLAAGRYVDTTFEPTYLADTADVSDRVYVSPAVPISDSGKTNFITSTYNTSDDDYATVNYSAQEDPDAKKNLPSFGRRRVLGHGNDMRFYLVPREGDAEAIQSRLPKYVRLGKKRGKVRIETEMQSVKRKSGSYELGHPIGAYDTEQTPVGNLVTKRMRPTPLVAQADFEGEYLSFDFADDDGVSTGLPADVSFLKQKR